VALPLKLLRIVLLVGQQGGHMEHDLDVAPVRIDGEETFKDGKKNIRKNINSILWRISRFCKMSIIFVAYCLCGDLCIYYLKVYKHF